MSGEFAIRQTIPNDKPNLKRIVDLSFPRFFRFFATHSLNEEGTILVTETQSGIIGFTKLIDIHLGSSKFGCILWLAVHPQFRRKGIANSLIKAGVQHFKQEGAKAVFASVQKRNIASLGVFSLQGFAKMGFIGLWRLFGWRVFEFYRDIWFAPGEVVLIKNDT